jgi:hypothetical protein
MINGHQLNIKTTIDDRNREINLQYIYIKMINGPCSIAKLLQQQEGILAAVFSVVLLVRMILNLDR